MGECQFHPQENDKKGKVNKHEVPEGAAPEA